MATETENPFPRSLPDGTPYVSPSQVKAVNGCGARYEWKYVLGNTHPAGESLHVGKLTHELVETWATGAPQDHDYLGHASQYVHDEVPSDVLERSELNAAGYVHEGLRLFEAFLRHAMQEQWTVVAAEDKLIDTEHHDPAFLGYLDLLVETEHGLTLMDLKTSGRAPSYGRAKERDAYQTIAYADVCRDQGLPIDHAAVLYLVRNKTAKVVEAPVDLSEPAVEWAWSVHEGGVKKIRRGGFEPNPFGGGYLCHPDRCGRWSTCPGAAKWREDDEDGEA